MMKHTQRLWEISKEGWGCRTILVIVLLLTSLVLPPGCSLLETYTPTEEPVNESVIVYPGQSAVFDGWFISLDGGRWNGGLLTVNITITNTSGVRRYFSTDLVVGRPVIVAVDSTDKVVRPEKSRSDGPMGEGFYYHKEFYPKESMSGELVYNVNKYSDRTSIYIVKSYNLSGSRIKLFDVGAPLRE